MYLGEELMGMKWKTKGFLEFNEGLYRSKSSKFVLLVMLLRRGAEVLGRSPKP